MLARLVGGGAHERPRQAARDVLIDRQHDFRLRAIALDDDLERLEIGERGFDGGGAHAFLRSPAP